MQKRVVTTIAGTPRSGSGYINGREAQFNSPNGLAYRNGTLYVADTGNKAIRVLDLKTKIVTTLIGGPDVKSNLQQEQPKSAKKGKPSTVGKSTLGPFGSALLKARDLAMDGRGNLLVSESQGPPSVYCVDFKQGAVRTALTLFVSEFGWSVYNGPPLKLFYHRGIVIIGIEGGKVRTADLVDGKTRVVDTLTGIVSFAVDKAGNLYGASNHRVFKLKGLTVSREQVVNFARDFLGPHLSMLHRTVLEIISEYYLA
jgi:hypothetical protein